MKEYHEALFDLVEEEGYDKYNDFAVVIQPGLKNMKLPKNYVNFFGYWLKHKCLMYQNICVSSENKLIANVWPICTNISYFPLN